MLKERVITAVIVFPAVLAALILGPKWLVAILVMTSIVLSTYEISLMLLPKFHQIFALKLLGSGRSASYPKWALYMPALLSIILFLSFLIYGHGALTVTVMITFILIFIMGVFLSKTVDESVSIIVSLLIATCYGSFPWIALWQLYLHYPQGWGVIFVLFVVVASDTGGYFGGRMLGRRKLAPTLSPNKTIEGAISGLFFSLLGGLAVNYLSGFSLGSTSEILLASLVGSVFCQLGDLVESTFKRFGELKDSGTLFPGHGGFLDRVDGLIFAAPIIWAIQIFSLS